MLEPGHIIDRYRILRVLGQGGMAVVYAAEHIELGSLHAIKVLMITTQHLRDRALQEGRIQAGLNHPNIVSVSDVVRLHGAPALVMELVRGPSLEGYLQLVRPNFDQIDALARGILDGLELAHHSGRIHRDLKPANVLLAVENGSVVAKLADFGLAKILSGDALSHSRTGVTMGTPAYMAPEQFRDAKNVDERADIFSVGVLLYELCTGAVPYVGQDMISLFQAIAAGEYVRPSERVPELPIRMERAINKALHADPAHRHSSVEELREVWCDGRPVPERPWSVRQAAELLLMGPELPTPTPLNAPSLRSATHEGPRVGEQALITESRAADAWEHITDEPVPDGATFLPENLGVSVAPAGRGASRRTIPHAIPHATPGPVTVAPEPAPQPAPRLPAADPTLPPAERGSNGLLLVGVVAVVLFLMVGLWAWQGREQVPAQQPAAGDPVDVPTQIEPVAALQDAPVVALVEEPGPDPVGEPFGEEPAPLLERAKLPAQAPEPAVVVDVPQDKEPALTLPDVPRSTTSMRLQGVDRGYVVDGEGKQHGLGVLAPGKYKVYAFFDAAKATQVLEVELAKGQRVLVSCDSGMRMCRAK